MNNGKYLELEKILPHRSPMILIDRVLEYDVQKLALTAEVEITEDSMFYDIQIEGVPSWIGLEYMAQSIAALSGIMESEKNGGAPIMGFILGTRKYDNNLDCYKKGRIYKIEVEEQFNNMELCSFKCNIRDNLYNLCASAELNVFRPLDPDKFLDDLKQGKYNG